MVNKTFCDKCGKEMQQRNIWHFKLGSVSLGSTPTCFKELCKACADKILLEVKN